MGAHQLNQHEDDPGNVIGSGEPAEQPQQPAQTVLEAQEERRKIRRLQLMMDMVTSVIAQDETLSYENAAEMIADS